MTIGWNVLSEGEKLWACFPPSTDEDKLDSFLLVDHDGNDVSARDWFDQMQGKLPKECIVMQQKAGEVVFLPSGWFHVVLNLQLSTAISNSICIVKDFKEKWVDLWKEDREMAETWMERVAEDVVSKEEKLKLMKIIEEEQDHLCK